MSRLQLPGRIRACLGLGGNLGDPVSAMGAALRALDATPGNSVVAVSSVYRTPPWGKTDQPDFLNAAAAVDTELAPRELLDLCLSIERAQHRVRIERWGPRTVDIDVLVYGETEVHEPGLSIPHPRMLERAFVLVPLAEIAPDLVLMGRPVIDHRNALDASGIERLPKPSSWWR
jgi:2-amino-4-hydroxy-6-hydroxymethyldihydropteridine diphosphokinase